MPRFLRRGRWALTPPFHPYPGLAARAVCFLWHCLSARLSPAPPECISGLTGVTRPRTLRSSDFPPAACAASDLPPFQDARKMRAKPGFGEEAFAGGFSRGTDRCSSGGVPGMLHP